jgi:hypothetical protein
VDLRPGGGFWGEYDEYARHCVMAEVTGYWCYYKNGKPKYFLNYDVTWLKRCDRCGVLGGRRKIKYFYMLGYSDLCVSCWNKLRPIDTGLRILNECKFLTRKLRREITAARKVRG